MGANGCRWDPWAIRRKSSAQIAPWCGLARGPGMFWRALPSAAYRTGSVAAGLSPPCHVMTGQARFGISLEIPNEFAWFGDNS